MTARIGKTRIASHDSPYTVVAPMTAIVATVVGSTSEAPAMRPEAEDLRWSRSGGGGQFSCSSLSGPVVGALPALPHSRASATRSVPRLTPEGGRLSRAGARSAPNIQDARRQNL